MALGRTPHTPTPSAFKGLRVTLLWLPIVTFWLDVEDSPWRGNGREKVMEAAAGVEQSYGCVRAAAAPAMDHSSSADG